MKTKINNTILSVLIAVLVSLLFYCVYSITMWHSQYEIKLQKIFLVEPRDKPLTITTQAKARELDPTTLSTEDYICYKFGKDCKMALAISQAENGTRQCDRVVIEPNGTISVGLFQINSVHFKKGYTMKDLVDCHKNIDIAYDIFKAQGWSPWSTYKNKSYLKFYGKN